MVIFLFTVKLIFSKDCENSKTIVTVGKTSDKVAEWLRRWTANPFPSGSVGSNPILVDILFEYCNDQFLS